VAVPTEGSAGGGDRARLFVALDLDDDVRRILAGWRDPVLAADARIRPVAIDALHVTLCFLGICLVRDVGAIAAAACAIVPAAPLDGLRLGAATWLPRRRPRVLAVKLEDETGALTSAQAALAEVLAAGGWYRPEARRYLAHVTVARVGRDARLPLLPAAPSAAIAQPATITLYRSHLSPGGSRYEALRVLSPSAGPAGASELP